MRITLTGRARKFGDDVNTDYIIASTRKRDTLDESQLTRYLMEALDPTFAASVRPGDLIVAGHNFGCGSAMEIASTVILAAGIKAVLAKSFSRTFYRNAVNNGLIPLIADTDTIAEGNRLTIAVTSGIATIRNETACTQESSALAMPEMMVEILELGGIVPYLRKHSRFVTTHHESP